MVLWRPLPRSSTSIGARFVIGKRFKAAQERYNSNGGDADAFEDAEVTDHRDARFVEICLISCPTPLVDSPH